MNIELSDNQSKIIAAALTTLSAGVVITGIILFLVYTSRFFQAFDTVFLPLVVAGVLAMVLEPWYEWLNAKMPAGLAILIVFLSLILPAAALATFFGTVIATQMTELLDQLPNIWNSINSWFSEHRPKLDSVVGLDNLGSKIEGILKIPGAALTNYLFSSIVSTSSSIASSVVSLLSWIIFPVYLTFFLMIPKLRPGALEPTHLPFLKPATAENIIFLIKEFFSLVVIFFRGQILIGLLQGVLLAIGFSLVGLKYGVILGLLLGFLNIIPFLGSMLGLSVCLPMAWFQDGGGGTLLAIVILIFGLVQAFESYYLTPKIMGNATGLHPLAIIFGIFFWGVALNGILGMILAIPLTAFVVVLWRLVKEKYMKQLL